MPKEVVEDQDDLDVEGGEVSESDLTDMFDQFADERMGVKPDEADEEDDDDSEEPDDDGDDADDNTGEDEGDTSDKDESEGKDASAKDGDPSDEPSKDYESELEKLRKERDEWEHKFKSNDGRVSALQKKINELEGADQVVSPEEFTKALSNEDSWKEFAEENPELAAPLEKFLKGFAENLSKSQQHLQGQVTEIKESTSQQAEAAADDAIDKAIPGWQKMVADEKNGFNTWLSKQPAYVHTIIDSGTTEESISVLNNFRDHLKASGLLKDEPSKDSDDSDEDDETKKKIAQTKRKRKKQLEDGSAPESSGGSAQPTKESASEDDLFNLFAGKKEDENARHRRR